MSSMIGSHLKYSILAILLVAIGTGCAHTGATPDAGVLASGASGDSAAQNAGAAGASGSAEVMGPEAPFGPLPEPGYTPPKDGYVLILGPGLARTLAFVGVLRELEAHAVPIHAVVGVEMGAVVAGIWASSNANNLEWQMHKIRRDTLLDPPVFGLGDHVAEGKKLYGFLDDALKAGLLQQMKVQAIVASASPKEEALITESNGSAKDIIRGAMGIPGLIKPYVWDSRERESAAITQPYPTDAAKALALGKVLCVDVVGSGDNFQPHDSTEAQIATLMKSIAALSRQQLKACDETIAVPLDNVGYLDFDARAELVSRGREAAKKWLEAGK